MNEPITLLRGGTVIDGTGASAQRADVLISGDRIAAIGPDLHAPSECKIVDVTDRTVTPGFIDLHSHADMTVLAFPSSDSALRQGITTVATGNCGGGVAPINAHRHVGDVAFAYDSGWQIDVDWTSFGEYADRLDGAGINVAPLVAHGPLRNAVIGLDPRPTTPAEYAQIAQRLDEALDDGAFGMSTGLEYQPGMWAALDELQHLAERVGTRERLYATHMRSRAAGYAAATQEALDTVTGTGARLQLSHFAPRPNAPHDVREQAFQLVQDATERNPWQIGLDTFPEVWGPALLIDLFPTWTFAGSTSEVLLRLRRTGDRGRIREHFEHTPGFLALIAGYSEIYLSDTPADDAWKGWSLTAIADELGITIADACCELLLAADDEFRSVAIRHIYATDADLNRTMRLDNCSLASDGVVTSGEGDACALTWNASTYGYAARTIEHFVRSTGMFTAEDAIRRMTSLPATQLGLRDRGTVTVGSFADLVVLDLATVHDRTTPDDMARFPTGIDSVLVNGRIAADSGSVAQQRHGRRLRP